jgi:hypothetical protein
MNDQEAHVFPFFFYGRPRCSFPLKHHVSMDRDEDENSVFRALVAFVGYFRRKDVDPVRPRLLPPHPMTSVTLFVTFP